MGMGAPPPPGDPLQKVSTPAMLMIVFASIAMVFSVASLVLNLVGAGLGGMFASGGSDAALQMFSGAVGMGFAGLYVLINAFVIYGALQMKKLTNYNISIAAAVLCMLPCGVCCLVNLPIGIWALVMLLDQGVKSAFTS